MPFVVLARLLPSFFAAARCASRREQVVRYGTGETGPRGEGLEAVQQQPEVSCMFLYSKG